MADRKKCDSSSPSILQLDDNSLAIILSYLDAKSFFNIYATCRRLKDLCSASYLQNLTIVRRKAIAIIVSYVLNEPVRSRYTEEEDEDEKERNTVRNMLSEGSKFASNLERLTLARVKQTWEGCGPVIGTLASCLAFYGMTDESGEPRATCITHCYEYLFVFPSQRTLTLKVDTFRDCIFNYDNQLRIEFHIDGQANKVRYNNNGPMDWFLGGASEVENSENSECLRPLTEFLHAELGKLHTPLEPELWMEFGDHADVFVYSRGYSYYKDPFISNSFVDEEKNIFEEATIQKQLSQSRKYAADKFGKEIASGFTSKKLIDLSKLVTVVGSKGNRGEINGWETAFEVGRHMFYHLKKQFDKVLLSCLLQRLDYSSYTGDWGAGSISDKYVSTEYKFICSNGEHIKVKGESRTDGQSYPSYMDQRLVIKVGVHEIKFEEKHIRQFADGDESVLSPCTSAIKASISEELDRIGRADLLDTLDNVKVLLFIVTALWEIYSAFCDLEDSLSERRERRYSPPSGDSGEESEED